MARKPRIEFEGAFYHVIARGNQRQRIFRDDGDHERYLSITADYKHRFKFLLYAYVLMPNHVHLLVETKETPLSKILQGLNQRYTQYFNRKYDKVGHLFQGRYKGILCDRDEYLLSLLKYIHLNPVRARLAQDPGAYPWSSHTLYISKTDTTELVDTDRVLLMFSDEKGRARRLYQAFVAESNAVTKDDVYRTIDQRILGDERFAEEVKEKYNLQLTTTKRSKEYTLGEIARAIERAYMIKLAAMTEKGRETEARIGRRIFSLLAKQYGYRGKEIAEYLKRDPSVITIYLKEGEGLEWHAGRLIEDLKHLHDKSNLQV